MANVELRVSPPQIEDVASVHVFESANPTGPFAEVFTTNAVGVYPDYIETLEVNTALAETDWFAVQWADASGDFLTPLSPPVKSADQSLVTEVINRVLQRDRSLDPDIVKQEVEGAMEYVFNKNPYGVTLADIPEGQQYRTLNGLAYLSMARSYIFISAGTKQVQSATLGLVSFRSESGSQRSVDVQELIDMANTLLGISTSLILQHEDIFDPDSSDYFFTNVNPVQILEP